MDQSNDIDWASLVDMFASQYGWSIEYICNLDLNQIHLLRNAINKRLNDKNGGEDEDDSIIDEDSDLDFAMKIGGKQSTRKDGTKEIVI